MGIEQDAKIKTAEAEYTIRGRASSPCTLMYNGNILEVGDDLAFEISYPLEQGENSITFTAYDGEGRTAEPQTIVIERDNEPPEFTYDEISTTTTDDMAVIRGVLNEDGEIRVNGIVVEGNGRSFKKLVSLTDGENLIYIQARDSVLNVMKPIELIVNKQSKEKEIMQVPHTDNAFNGEFVFDGDVSEWNLTYEPQLIADDPSCTAKFALAWDEENLYVAVAVEDESLNNSAVKAYNNDSVEIYLDGDNSKSTPFDEFDKQLFYQYDGVSTSSEYKTRITDYGYSMEIAIPWSKVNTEAQGDMLVGFDLDICDNNNGGSTRDGVLIFSGTVNDWCDTREYATLRLMPN